MLKKMERTGMISPMEVEERVGFIDTNIEWLSSQCQAYAKELGIIDELMDGLSEIEERADEAERKNSYASRIWARDYRVVKKTTYCEGWLYRNGFLYAIQRPLPDYTEELFSRMVSEARVRYYKEHPPVRLRRAADKVFKQLAAATKNIKFDEATLEDLDKGIEELGGKGDNDAATG